MLTKNIMVLVYPSTLLIHFYHACTVRSRQHYPVPTWVISLSPTRMDAKRVGFHLEIVMNSHDIKMKSVYNVFSNTITGGLLYEVLQ